MNKLITISIALPAIVAAFGVVAVESACNDVGTCPDAAITQGGTCSGDNLQCPYTLDTPNPTCDGTDVQLATSCVCTSGAWVCPEPFTCDVDAGDDTGTTDDTGTDTGTDDATTDANDAGGDDAADASGQ